MRAIFAIFTLCLSASASASGKDSEPVSIGKGLYMMTDRNITIFGSSDGIVAKLMTKANAFCRQTKDSEAVLVESGGSEAVPGTINSSGMLRQPAQGATGTIRFRCGDSPAAASVSPKTSLPAPYYQRVESLKSKVMGGEISVRKGIVSQQVLPAFEPLQSSYVEMIEGRSTWWFENGRWLIHLENVAPLALEAIQFSVNLGSCTEPTSPPQKLLIQLSRSIPSGEQALVSFTEPGMSKQVETVMCGVVTAAWGPRTPT